MNIFINRSSPYCKQTQISSSADLQQPLIKAKDLKPENIPTASQCTVCRHSRQQKTINSTFSLSPPEISAQLSTSSWQPSGPEPSSAKLLFRKPQEPMATALIPESSSDAGGGFDAITGRLLFGLIRRKTATLIEKQNSSGGGCVQALACEETNKEDSVDQGREALY